MLGTPSLGFPLGVHHLLATAQTMPLCFLSPYTQPNRILRPAKESCSEDSELKCRTGSAGKEMFPLQPETEPETNPSFARTNILNQPSPIHLSARFVQLMQVHHQAVFFVLNLMTKPGMSNHSREAAESHPPPLSVFVRKVKVIG